MLTEATWEDIERYGEMAYRLALEPGSSSYPTYRDGIKIKEDFFRAAEQAVSDNWSELLLFSEDGVVEGWLSYFYRPQDKYLQLDGCNLRRGTEQALTELLSRIGEHFGGYEAYFGFPAENREAVRFLQAHGFRQAELLWNHTFLLDGYTPEKDAHQVEQLWNLPFFFDESTAEEKGSRVEQITRQNFDRFRELYHPEPDAYWTADRIFEEIDDWLIYVYSRWDVPVAAVFLTGRGDHYEIFGMPFADGQLQEDVLRELLATVLAECSQLGIRYLTYFCAGEENAVLAALGFRCVGQYALYIKEL